MQTTVRPESVAPDSGGAGALADLDAGRGVASVLLPPPFLTCAGAQRLSEQEGERGEESHQDIARRALFTDGI